MGGVVLLVGDRAPAIETFIEFKFAVYNKIKAVVFEDIGDHADTSGKCYGYVNELQVEDIIEQTGATTVVCLWWPHILKRIQKLDINVINGHPSYLPYNRGKYPYYWSIVERTPFGATIHRVDDGVDSGDILWQKEIIVEPHHTGEKLYHLADRLLAKMFIEHMTEISNEEFPMGTPQLKGAGSSHTKKEFKEQIKYVVDLDDSYNRVLREMVDDLRARTFRNNCSGQKVKMDGRIYRIHIDLLPDGGELI
jgi:methionyl-tRNA formyltransferase